MTDGFYTQQINGLTILKSRLLDQIPYIRHAFSTRIGGISTEECGSLNLAWKRRDSYENVMENHRRFAHAMGIEPENFVFIELKHSDKVITVNKDARNNGRWWDNIPSDYDAVITKDKGAALLVRTADCGTILLLDTKRRVIAAVHSGWRGTSAGIIKNTIERMHLEFNSNPRDILAAAGPSICSECFLAHQPVYSQFPQKYLTFYPDGRAGVDLRGKMLDDMLASGLLRENIDFCASCTCENPELFFSHRREHGRTGIMAASIQLI